MSPEELKINLWNMLKIEVCSNCPADDGNECECINITTIKEIEKILDDFKTYKNVDLIERSKVIDLCYEEEEAGYLDSDTVHTIKNLIESNIPRFNPKGGGIR